MVYLDNAATSFPKPDIVADAMSGFIKDIGVNAGRGAYRQALKADEMVWRTRSKLAKLFNINNPQRIIFAANVTEALNVALKGLIVNGDHIITTNMEHNAVWRPLKRLERERGIEVTAIPVSVSGEIDYQELERSIKASTRCIAMLHGSNVIGNLLPVKSVGAIARRHGVPLVVDAAQTAGCIPIDVADLGIDIFAFTGHKGLLGPMGTGGLYVGDNLDLEPFKDGGTGGDSILETMPDYLPDRFEAGTQNLPGIAGLGAAAEYLLEQGIENIREHERRLLAYAWEELSNVKGLILYGGHDKVAGVPVITFNIAKLPAEEVAYALDQAYGIMVRSGLHCAPQAHRTIGTERVGTVRVSFGYFNKEQDIRQLAAALNDISKRV